jgi:hypothetical protein
MKNHNHEHRSSSVRHSGQKSEKVRLHKDWRVWVGVGVMLLAMLVYVVTLDDSIVPAVIRQ